MGSSHAAGAVDVMFDDPNLIADAGLVLVVAMVEQIGLPELVAEHVVISGAANSAGANPAAKVMSLLAGTVAGADSVADVDQLQHASNSAVFDEIRAISTPGTFLRAFTHGHLQQLNGVLRQALVALARRAPHGDPQVAVGLMAGASTQGRDRVVVQFAGNPPRRAARFGRIDVLVQTGTAGHAAVISVRGSIGVLVRRTRPRRRAVRSRRADRGSSAARRIV
jgi:hypothetical protein